MESTSSSSGAVLETLTRRGWCLGDLDQVNALIQLQSALADDADAGKIADSVESELLNMDLRSIGGKSLPDANLVLRKSSHLLGPKVLQISSVRDISRSSMEDLSGNSGSRHLLRLILTDGKAEITAIEYTSIPSLTRNIVPGTKVRLENKLTMHYGILCLNPKAITVMGGVVQSLYEEWEMNKKYIGISRASLRSETGGPPPFEKLEIQAPLNNRFPQQSGPSYFPKSSKRDEPTVSDLTVNSESKPRSQQTVDLKADRMNTSSLERTEEKPSTSETRTKEVIESIPIQNQAASQKLLQKMSNPNPHGQHSRGRRGRGKQHYEETAVFTLDEWEKKKAGVKVQMTSEDLDTSQDEDLARQLQRELDLEDYHVQNVPVKNAEDIRLSMFNYERDDNRAEHGGRGRGKGRGRRGRGRGRFG